MRSAEEIEKRIKEIIEAMLKRPMMFVDSPLGLESMILGNLELLRFIRGGDEDVKVVSDWRKFAMEAIGYSGAKTVSGWMRDENRLGEDWKGLMDLLKMFVEVM